MTYESVSRRTYVGVFAALMVLLIASAWVAQYSFGEWNLIVAVGISVAKTALIMLFFMHLIHASRLTRLIALGGLLWFGFLIILTFSDYGTRGWRTDALPEYHERAVDRATDRLSLPITR